MLLSVILLNFCARKTRFWFNFICDRIHYLTVIYIQMLNNKKKKVFSKNSAVNLPKIVEMSSTFFSDFLQTDGCLKTWNYQHRHSEHDGTSTVFGARRKPTVAENIVGLQASDVAMCWIAPGMRAGVFGVCVSFCQFIPHKLHGMHVKAVSLA